MRRLSMHFAFLIHCYVAMFGIGRKVKAKTPYMMLGFMVAGLMIGSFNVTAEGPIPDDDNPIGYLHLENEESNFEENEEAWINQLISDPESVGSQHVETTSTSLESKGYWFYVRDSPDDDVDLDNDLYFCETNSTSNFTVHIEFERGAPDELEFRLYNSSPPDVEVIDEVILGYNEEGIYNSSWNISGKKIIPAGNRLYFILSWYTPDAGLNSWTIFLNNKSYIEFPIAIDSNDNGIPDYLEDEPEPPGDPDPDPDPNDSDTDNQRPTRDKDGNLLPGFGISLSILAVVVTAFLISKNNV